MIITGEGKINAVWNLGYHEKFRYWILGGGRGGASPESAPAICHKTSLSTAGYAWLNMHLEKSTYNL